MLTAPGQTDTRIAQLRARRVWDSRGRPTLEAEVTLADGSTGRAMAPAGASRGSREALELRDGGTRLGGLDVTLAVAGVNGEIAALLRGMDAADQAGIDAAMIARDGTPAKARLGELGLNLADFGSGGRLPPVATRHSTHQTPIVPPARVRYLAEIADTLRGYKARARRQARLAREVQQLRESARMLHEADSEKSGAKLDF